MSLFKTLSNQRAQLAQWKYHYFSVGDKYCRGGPFTNLYAIETKVSTHPTYSKDVVLN